ncbi:hypothetical protein [Flavobacterium sp. 3HN19-14]|uniref:hypothetical protein n=1 Tax=Flavobacterium sp. 3HN19-14 TaxID=3448133 RepID=UPI003EE2A045
MKKLYFLTVLFFGLFSVNGFSQISTTPTIPEANAPVTVNFNKAGTPLASATAIYAYIGVTVNGVLWQNIKGGGNSAAEFIAANDISKRYNL